MEPLFEPPEGFREKPYTVSEISRLVKSTLEAEFPSIWVEGEISRITAHPSGHIYMTLKEGRDTLDANLWKQKRSILKFEPEQGMQVLVKGRISSYPPYSKYNLIVERIEPAGIGALQIKFEQLKKKLEAQGYFGEERKKPLPLFPQTIGVVTSGSGAAFRDIARILQTRDPGIRIILAPVLVEGEKAKVQIAEAIDDFNRLSGVDVLIVGRGGGSPESLWAFNEEVVADAIFRSEIPVISAVGHEIDFTISDFVADRRASTPSNAAEIAVKVRADVIHTVKSLASRLVALVRSAVSDRSSRISDLLGRTVFADPARFLEDYVKRADECLTRITKGAKRNRLDLQNRFEGLYRHLKLLKPENLIKRRREKIGVLQSRLWLNMRAALAGKQKRYSEFPASLFRQKMLAVLAGKRQLTAVAAGKLDMLSPLKVLERGYAIARKKDGTIIRDESQVAEGEDIKVRLEKSAMDCRVISKERIEETFS